MPAKIVARTLIPKIHLKQYFKASLISTPARPSARYGDGPIRQIPADRHAPTNSDAQRAIREPPTVVITVASTGANTRYTVSLPKNMDNGTDNSEIIKVRWEPMLSGSRARHALACRQSYRFLS